MSTPDPVPAPAVDPATCPHQFGGQHDGGQGYACKLCNTPGDYDPNQGAIVPVPPA